MFSTPMRSTYCSAAPRPTASAMLPVAASKRVDGSWSIVRSLERFALAVDRTDAGR